MINKFREYKLGIRHDASVNKRNGDRISSTLVSNRLRGSPSIAIFEYFSFLSGEADKILYDAKELTLDFRALLSPRSLPEIKGWLLPYYLRGIMADEEGHRSS